MAKFGRRLGWLALGLACGCTAPGMQPVNLLQAGAPKSPAQAPGDSAKAAAQAPEGEAAVERLGKVDFPVSCNAAAKREFERGAALLHSFWYDESARRFEAAAKADPGCAMAYWGVAMAQYHPLWVAPSPEELAKGAAAVASGLETGAGTARERDYLAAIAEFYRDRATRSHRERAAAYEARMGDLARRYPADQEARIFHALALLGTADPADKTYAKQKRAGEILTGLFEKLPDHPGVAHYIIHAYDYPELAKLALPAARRYAAIAPAAPHALHMPSHIFTRLGLWEEAVRSNLDSAKAAKASGESSGMRGMASFDRLHAMDYLMYAYLQTGEDRKAAQLLEEAASIPVSDLEPPNFAAAYALAAMPARYALERGKWEEAKRLELGPAAFPWERFPYAKAIIHFARALGSARSGNPAPAAVEVRTLEALRDNLDEAGDSYWRDQVEIYRRTAAAWIALAKDDRESALTLMQSAADLEAATEKHPVTPGAILPARELLGDLFQALGQPAAARRAYEASNRNSPGRLRGQMGEIQVAGAS